MKNIKSAFPFAGAIALGAVLLLVGFTGSGLIVSEAQAHGCCGGGWYPGGHWNTDESDPEAHTHGYWCWGGWDPEGHWNTDESDPEGHTHGYWCWDGMSPEEREQILDYLEAGAE